MSKFPAMILAEERCILQPDVLYTIEQGSNDMTQIIDLESGQSRFIDLMRIDSSRLKEGLMSFHYRGDDYIFLYPFSSRESVVSLAKCFNKDLLISLSRELVLSYAGNEIFRQEVRPLEYSTCEELGEYCILYFEGERKFAVILKSDVVLMTDYYDEINIDGKERFFMTRLSDEFAHGKVCCIKDGKFDSYLISLDEARMNADRRFVVQAFMDALKVGNYKMCNSILAPDIQQEEPSGIASFFPDFDDYYPIREDAVVLIKKNALAGIYEFEIRDSLISNITDL